MRKLNINRKLLIKLINRDSHFEEIIFEKRTVEG